MWGAEKLGRLNTHEDRPLGGTYWGETAFIAWVGSQREISGAGKTGGVRESERNLETLLGEGDLTTLEKREIATGREADLRSKKEGHVS